MNAVENIVTKQPTFRNRDTAERKHNLVELVQAYKYCCENFK